jgi:hypothetical protein
MFLRSVYRLVTLQSWVFGMGSRNLFKRYIGVDPVGLELPLSNETLAGIQMGRLLRFFTRGFLLRHPDHKATEKPAGEPTCF